MTPEDVVRANFDASLRQDRAACESLLADEMVFTSPQDDHIDRAAFLERCFPTAERVSRQELIHVTPADERDVFILYEYDLKTGGTHRNAEVITVVDEHIVEVQVLFGGAVSHRPKSGRRDCSVRINLISVYVDDQRAALAFYTDVLGFTKHRDIPLGSDSWLTVVSPDAPEGPELLLEPAGHPAVKPYRDALVQDGIPCAQFAVDDLEAEHARLTGLGVDFTQPPKDIGSAVVAVLDDTCGNLIQLIAEK